MGAFGKTSRRQIQVSERVLRVVDLRLQGHNLREIAKVIGVSAPTVWRDLVRYLKGIGETIETKRGLSEARLDRALLRMHPRLEAGEPEAVRTLVSVESRRAKLRGLDAPVEVRKAVVSRVVIDFNLNGLPASESAVVPVAAPSPLLLPPRTATDASSPTGGLGVDSEMTSIPRRVVGENASVDVAGAPGTETLADTTALECKQEKRAREPIELTALSVPVAAWRESERRVWSEYRPGRTLQEIATALGLTRERVRQVLNTIQRERVVGVGPNV